MCTLQVSAMLILGGAAVMTALTGMNLYAVRAVSMRSATGHGIMRDDTVDLYSLAYQLLNMIQLTCTALLDSFSIRWPSKHGTM